MGFLNSLKSMVGSGAPTVEVKLLKSKAAMQESVKGIATFKGGEYPTTIDEVVLYIVTVEEIKEKDKTKESDEKVGRITFNDYSLEPNEEISLPFQLKIPKDNLITSEAITHFIKVKIDINGKDAFGIAPIHVV